MDSKMSILIVLAVLFPAVAVSQSQSVSQGISKLFGGRMQPCGPRLFLPSSYDDGRCSEVEACPDGEYEFSGDCGSNMNLRCCMSKSSDAERDSKRDSRAISKPQIQPLVNTRSCLMSEGNPSGKCSAVDDSKSITWTEVRQKYPTSMVKCVKGTGQLISGARCDFCCFGGYTEEEFDLAAEHRFSADVEEIRLDLERHMRGSFSDFRNWFPQYIVDSTRSALASFQFQGISPEFLNAIADFFGARRYITSLGSRDGFDRFQDLVSNTEQTASEAHASVAATNLISPLAARWGEASKREFIDNFLGKIRARAKKIYSREFLTMATINTNQSSNLRNSILSFRRVPVDNRPGVLKNFFYGHRSYAALGPMILRDPKERKRFLDFVEAMSWTVSSSSYTSQEIRNIIAYYKQLPRTIPVSESDISKVVSAMEGNPYMAAWALVWISRQNAKSNAVDGATTWLQQPIEVDIYIPPYLAESMRRGERINWSSVINMDIKVGHGKTLTMIKELALAKYSQGCEVTESNEIQKFIELGTWIRLVNVALSYIVSERPIYLGKTKIVDPNILTLSSTKSFQFNELLNIDLQLILDIKCQFDAGTPIDGLLKALNDEYGVVVAGVGSFYKIPTLTHVQVGSKTNIVHPAVGYHWFFSPKNLEQGLKEKRISEGATALVTASSLIRDTTPKGSNRCTYEVNSEAINVLRRVKAEARLSIGIWTQESQLTRDAARFLFEFANREREMFNVGFAVGGPHDPEMWPLQSKCSDIGGLADFSFIPNK